MAAVILIWFALLLRKEVCYAVTSVNLSTDVLIPSIGEDIHLLCNFMPWNQHANIFIIKDKATRLSSKICFSDGDCNTYNSNSGKMTWHTDESSAELTINKWSMSDQGDYQCIVDNIRSNTVNLRKIMPEQPDTPEIILNDLIAGEESKINCTSNNGYQSPVIYWYMESRNLTMNSSFQTERSENGRWKATSTLTFTPLRHDNGKGLICQVVQPTAPLMSSQNETVVLNILYPPIISLRLLDNVEAVSSMTSVEFECTADANPKVLNFAWYLNRLTLNNSTRHRIILDRLQSKTVSTSRLITNDVQRMHSGKYQCHVITVLGNASATLNFSYISDPPSRLIVDQNQTTSSTLFVAWQPGFDGGFQQTFNLEYCPNDTAAMEEECGVITDLTQPSFTLDGLKAFTWYRLTLWAENSAGNSSAVTAMTSTAPLQPENYGVSITRVGVGQVLHIQKANQSLGEVCFVLKSSNESCALLDKSKCIYPTKGIKEVSADADDDVVVTYGRGLCSEPANITDQPGPTVPSSDQGTPDMIIAIGVIASISVIIVISLGLMYFYGLMCCTKRKKENGDQQEGRTVDEDGLVYISVAHDRTHPPNAPPIQTEEPTIYASLNKDATKHRKGEMEYSDTKATTPDGQPMYGNYLVKQRKQEQARMPPPVQADDASYRADGSRRSEGAIGPTMPDGQPMYGNYLVKMRKEQERAEQERAEQMAGTYNFFEMYSI